MKCIADTGALYALMDKSDRWHGETKDFVERTQPKLFIPSPVIPEVCYLTNKYLGWHAEHAFLRSIVRREVTVKEISSQQFQDILFYLEKYKDLNIGFVDASLIIAAEALGIHTIFTVDERHFKAIRTKKGKLLQIVP